MLTRNTMAGKRRVGPVPPRTGAAVLPGRAAAHQHKAQARRLVDNATRAARRRQPFVRMPGVRQTPRLASENLAPMGLVTVDRADASGSEAIAWDGDRRPDGSVRTVSKPGNTERPDTRWHGGSCRKLPVHSRGETVSGTRRRSLS